MSHPRKRYMEADRRTRTAAMLVASVYFVSSLVVCSYDGNITTIKMSAPHYVAFWWVCVAMWIAAGHFVSLVVQSIGPGCFSNPSSRVPVRQRIWSNTSAYFARAVAIVTAVSLVMLSAIYIWPVLVQRAT
jgi:hypothetical protein